MCEMALAWKAGFNARAPRGQGARMTALKIPPDPGEPTWEYDEEADVLYLSVGEPRPAVGVDIGEGVVLRLDEEREEVVGLTLLGLRARLLEGLGGGGSGPTSGACSLGDVLD